MRRVLFICATHRDHREVDRLTATRTETYFFHDYATLALEQLIAEQPPAQTCIGDPEKEIEHILRYCQGEAIDCVVSTDDYPGSTLASIVARALRLPGVDPTVNLLCQHKYHARRKQRAIVPEATPRFALIDDHANMADESALPEYPCFVKPVKSLFSVGAQRVDSKHALAGAVRRATLPALFFDPFESLLKRYSALEMEGYVLAEALLQGRQCTLEGYAYQGSIHVLGIVDSIMFPGTLCFARFDYPSYLPASVQERMSAIAQRLMAGIGYDNGAFNIEFMYDPGSDAVAVIEINPRMSSQFADLFEKVDGTNTYHVLLDLAADKAPRCTRRAGQFARAASCVLRTFQNMKALRVPSPSEIETVQALWPDVRIEVLTEAGHNLAQELQDGRSYRYGVVNLGGRDDQEISERLQQCLARLPFVFAAA